MGEDLEITLAQGWKVRRRNLTFVIYEQKVHLALQMKKDKKVQNSRKIWNLKMESFKGTPVHVVQDFFRKNNYRSSLLHCSSVLDDFPPKGKQKLEKSIFVRLKIGSLSRNRKLHDQIWKLLIDQLSHVPVKNVFYTSTILCILEFIFVNKSFPNLKQMRIILRIAL